MEDGRAGIVPVMAMPVTQAVTARLRATRCSVLMLAAIVTRIGSAAADLRLGSRSDIASRATIVAIQAVMLLAVILFAPRIGLLSQWRSGAHGTAVAPHQERPPLPAAVPSRRA
jgi:ABC-type Mn2+/Zn2+ transport system permease subunit